MSTPGEDFVVRQEPDVLPARRLVGIFVAALVTFGAAVVVAARMLPHTGTPPPPHAAPRQIGLVEQSIIGQGDHGLRLRREQLQRLESYGWVDRDAGVAHVPIERAIGMWREQGGKRE